MLEAMVALGLCSAVVIGVAALVVRRISEWVESDDEPYVY